MKACDFGYCLVSCVSVFYLTVTTTCMNTLPNWCLCRDPNLGFLIMRPIYAISFIHCIFGSSPHVELDGLTERCKGLLLRTWSNLSRLSSTESRDDQLTFSVDDLLFARLSEETIRYRKLTSALTDIRNRFWIDAQSTVKNVSSYGTIRRLR